MTTRRLLRAALLSVVLACALPMPAAQACSCAVGPGGDVPLEGTVFYGEIVRRDVKGQMAVYVVDVERVYAGEAGTRAEVHTSAHGASCGLELPGSGSAVVYTRNEDGRLTSILCSGTRTADGPPANLGAGRPPTGATSAGETAGAAPRGDGPGDGSRDGLGVLPFAAGGFLVLAGLGLVAVRLRRPSLRPTAPGPAA